MLRGFYAGRDGRQVRLSLFQRYRRPQARDQAQETFISRRAVRKRQGNPNIGRSAAESKSETGRHDCLDAPAPAVETYRLPEDSRICAEPAAPKRVAQDDGISTAGLAL